MVNKHRAVHDHAHSRCTSKTHGPQARSCLLPYRQSAILWRAAAVELRSPKHPMEGQARVWASKFSTAGTWGLVSDFFFFVVLHSFCCFLPIVFDFLFFHGIHAEARQFTGNQTSLRENRKNCIVSDFSCFFSISNSFSCVLRVRLDLGIF